MNKDKFAFFENRSAMESWANMIDQDFLLVDIPIEPPHARRLNLILLQDFKVLPIKIDYEEKFLCFPL